MKKAKAKSEVKVDVVLVENIWRAAMFGMLDKVKEICDAAAGSGAFFDVDAVDECGATALVYASRGGHVDVVRFLVEKGASVELPGYGGMRPLHHAINHLREPTCSLLLELNADANATDSTGCTAMHYAAQAGALNVLVKLIEKDANVNATSKTNMVPLHKAAQAGGDAIARKLIEFGAEVDAQDSAGNSALHYAAMVGFPNFVRLLLGNSASTKVQNKAKQTAADCAMDDDIRAMIHNHNK